MFVRGVDACEWWWLLMRGATLLFVVILILYIRLHFLCLGFCNSRHGVARERDAGVLKTQWVGNFGLFSFSLGFRQFLCVLLL